MTEYRWKWCKPDRPGVWAFGGWAPGEQSGAWCVIEVDCPNVSESGWWRFLMPLPEILPPKKKTVWRMWVAPYCPVLEQPTAYTPIWCKDGERPSECSAIRTDKTEEREE